jgi:hypothetical protein
MAPFLVNPKLFNAQDYDRMFIRGEDGRVRYVHTSNVCANCVRKIMASNR